MTVATRSDEATAAAVAEALVARAGGLAEGSGRVLFRCLGCGDDAAFSGRTGRWRCVSGCGSNGDAAELAARFGVPVSPPTTGANGHRPGSNGVAPPWGPPAAGDEFVSSYKDGGIGRKNPGDAGRRRVRFVTAKAFAAETPAETAWVVTPWVAAGALTKIDGAPKSAGKTTFTLRMVRAVLTGEPFLGQPVKRGPVVVLSEQGGTSFREALAGAGLLEREDLFLATYRDVAGIAWPDVVADAFALAVEVGAALVVVDTLPAVSGVRGDDENSAGRALATLEPVQVAADAHGIGTLLSFHDRKSGGEVGESGRGSNAFAGGVDVVVQLSRPGGNIKPTVRKIQALSRFGETPDELFVELTPAGYVSLGREENVVSAMVGASLARALPPTEDAAAPVGEVKKDGVVVEAGLLAELKALGVEAARSTVDAELDRWRRAGYADRRGVGKKGSPFRWWLVAEPPPEFFLPMPSSSKEGRKTNAAGPEPGDPGDDPSPAGEMRSSDAHPPSEERNGAGPMVADGDEIRRDGATDSWGGEDERQRRLTDHAFGRECAGCGAALDGLASSRYCDGCDPYAR